MKIHSLTPFTTTITPGTGFYSIGPSENLYSDKNSFTIKIGIPGNYYTVQTGL